MAARFVCTLFLVFLFCTPAFSADYALQEDVALNSVFSAVTGTIVVYDVQKNVMHIYNKTRAETRFSPASTFKIPNTLIGLGTGAVQSVKDTFLHDGKPKFLKSWEKDMDLQEAIKVSSVPVYQQLARRVGLERMQVALTAIGYGNAVTGDAVDTFWLEGPLEISAVEQALFLARLATKKLPYPVDIQEQVCAIVALESTVDITGKPLQLFGKTGFSSSTKPNVGWWVGWVESSDTLHTFAMNMDMANIHDKEALNDRVRLGKASLQALGIWPATVQ